MTKPNLFFMFGQDTFAQNVELTRWRSAFKQKHGEHNLEVLEGGKLKASEIRDLFMAAPFLAEKRLIIIKDFLSSHKSDVQSELIPYLDEIPESSILVLSENALPDKRLKLTKTLMKVATVKNFEAKTGMALLSWLSKYAKERGFSLPRPLANALVERVGEDAWQLAKEIEKLALLASNREINLEVLNEVTKESLESSIFTMTEALSQKNHKKALRLIKELIENGNEAPYLFAMILRELRLLLEIKALQETGKSPSNIASSMKVHPFVVKKTLAQCRNFTFKELKSKINTLRDIDKRLKTGGIPLAPKKEDHYLLALEMALLS